MPICITLHPFNWINLETEIWQDAIHPAIEDRAAVCCAGSSRAFLLPTCHCPALPAAPCLLSPLSSLLVLGWNRVPLKLQRHPAIHNSVTSAAFCASHGLLPLFLSPSSQCLHLRSLKLSFWLCVFLSCSSKLLQILTAQQGWEDGCTLRETAHCLALGRTDQAPSGTFPGTSYSSFPCWALKTLLNTHNFFHVPGHSQLTNMQHYEN